MSFVKIGLFALTFHTFTCPVINPELLVSQLSLRQKIAQLIIAAAVSNDDRNKDFMAGSPYRMDKKYLQMLITEYQIGGIIFLGSGIIAQQAKIINEFRRLSIIPLLMALDAEWGLTMRLIDGLRFPRNMTLGALTDDQLIYQLGHIIGIQLMEIGIQMNLAPVMDVNNNPDNPVIHDRSFGSDPLKVAQKGIQFFSGLQNAGIIACAKHFPGHGDTDVDSHYALPIILHDQARLDAIELVPFRAAIENGVMAIMTAHIQIPSLEPDGLTPATLSKKITTDLLRTQLGFDGLIITDGLGMQGITNHYKPGQIEVEALKAGVDILLCPVDVPCAINAIEQAVKNGEITQEAIDEKVLRVLHAKEWALSLASDWAEWAGTLSDSPQRLKSKLYSHAITIVKDTLDPRRDKSADMIIEITGMNKFKKQKFGIPDHLLNAIKKFKGENQAVTVVLYGSPYAVELVADADRIIIAYEDDPDAHRAVAQVLAGTMNAKGTLPV